jgi:hypothetical protein
MPMPPMPPMPMLPIGALKPDCMDAAAFAQVCHRLAHAPHKAPLDYGTVRMSTVDVLAPMGHPLHCELEELSDSSTLRWCARLHVFFGALVRVCAYARVSMRVRQGD